MAKYLGAAYWIYLGVRLLLSKDRTPGAPAVAAQGARRALGKDIIVEALNVKTALFFLAFLPQFVEPSQPPAWQLIALGSVCVFLNTAVDVVAVFAAERLLKSYNSSNATRTSRARWLTRASGVTMFGRGAYWALAKRGQ